MTELLINQATRNFACMRKALDQLVQCLHYRYNLLTLIRSGAIAAMIVLWAMLALYLQHEKSAAMEQAVQLTGNYARAFEEHTIRTVRAVDQTTMFVKHEFERLGRRFDLASYTRDGVFLDKFYNLISVVGRDGWIVMADRSVPNSNLSDREHVLVHVPSDSGALYISKPVLGRSSGKWSIQFTRRINEADGTYGGVVVTSLDPNYFSDFYRSVDLGEQGLVALVGTDGIARARRTGKSSEAGQDLRGSELFRALERAPHGHFAGASSVDGIRRYYSYRKLDNYPLVVVVGVPEHAALADYNEHRNLLLVICIAVTLLLGAAATAILLLMRAQQHVNDALRNSEKAAQSHSKMKSEFIARMSHELRTPLNGILGFSEYLKDEIKDSEQRECAATIHQAGHHLLSLVNTTLDLAKIEAGHMEIERRNHNPAEIIDRVVSIQRAFAGSKGLRLTSVIAADVPKCLHCDQTRLLQTLNNLIHNAIKFTDAGEVSVYVDRHAEGVLFTVADTGSGIPTASQSAVFERFRQADTFATRKQEGSGLGLALARELVELMGGRIWMKSRVGEGTVFHFTLPA
jgi:signal transduction histidine kinase